MSVVISRKVSS